MASIVIYGIKNCDTMKKAFKWLEAKGVDFTFHDYKKQGVDEAILRAAIDQCGWDTVINRRGTTWRKLPDDLKGAMDADSALNAAIKNPSMIKRPMLVHENKIHLSFCDEDYERIFK